MKNVEKFPQSEADKALCILEQAWAYYMPQPKPTEQIADKDAPQNFAYYEAA